MVIDLNSSDFGREATEQIAKKKKEELFHDIARRLVEKQGFLFAAREFIKEQPIYYDGHRMWWLWNKKDCKWELVDETDVLNIVTMGLRQYNIGDASVKLKNNLIEALRQEGRLSKPKPFPKNWIQFKNEIFDLESKQTFQSTPEYFCVNPIPWSIGTDEDTPTVSALFDDWVGPENSQTLFELVAYVCYTGYPIHRLFCLNGGGRNGKSSFQGLTTKFVGVDNTCSVELDELTEKSNRFSSFSLYKKLCCLMGETNFNLITNANMLKKLTGGDLIKFEKKGADPFQDYNYAKIIISTNHLPPSADQSDGYYSRWIIIDFVKQYPESKDILATIPDYEYRNLAKKVTLLLPALLERHGFVNQGDITERRKRYLERSNPLVGFLEDFYVMDVDNAEPYSKVYTHYAHWLKENNRRVPSQKIFSQLINMEGFEIKNTSRKNEMGEFEKAVYILGIRRRESLSDFSQSSSSWQDWLDTQDGGTAEVDDLIRQFPLLDYEQLRSDGEVYEPRPGFVRRII